MLCKISLLGGKIVFYLILIALPVVALAGEYYVSPSGSAEWPVCANIETPCSPKTAMSNAIAGDTVYFRGGTYNIPFTGWVFEQAELYPLHSGTPSSPITFKNYPNEVPLLNATGMPTWDDGNKKTQQAQILGNGYQEYIIYDGFHLQAEGGERMASLIIFGSDESSRVQGIVLKNLNINGGSMNVTVDTNNDLIRLEKTDGAIVTNCKLYNNKNVNLDEDDTCAIKLYNNSNLRISHNEIQNCNTGIFLKRDTVNGIFEYNWIEGCTRALRITPYSGYTANKNIIRHNLLTNNQQYSIQSFSSESTHMDDVEIYNNTIFAPSASKEGIMVSQGLRANIYNNIVEGHRGKQLEVRNSTTIAKADHNNYGSYSLGIAINSYDPTYTSLSSWQSSGVLIGGGEPGVGSFMSDPIFINASGKMNQLEDFRLTTNSPCRGSGRAGLDIGADIDLVGILGGGGSVTSPQQLATVKDFILIQ